ncbi:MAG TPA: SDR family NAD(P)-dependent oxidoreductase, partial [Polyangiaceae bacterium]
LGLAWQSAAHGGERWDGIVFAAPPPETAPLECDASLVFGDALALSQQLVAHDAEARVWFVTRGAAAVVPSDTVDGLSGAVLWGLRSVFAAEYPRLRVSCLDLDSAALSLAALATELLARADDEEVALRGGMRFVRRLGAGLAEPLASPSTKAQHRPYRLVSTARGVLDSLALEVSQRPSPQASEIEIEVVASGLNFMNVLGALGACPGFPDGVGPLGIECAGRVVRVGSGVTRFALGERVMAFARDSMATHALAHERLALRVPEALDFEQAATIPIAYLTAYYALRHLARLAPGERVLVHSAAGGVGLAALAVARQVGAEVIATAGSAAKRDWLHSHGIEHVGDSRSLAFVDFTRRVTGGEGVDVVLNSLAGEAASASLGLLRRGGRFVELGKRDIYDNRPLGLRPFSRNLAYFGVDLERMAREQPNALGALLGDMTEAIESGAYPPLPRTVYGSAEAKAAFQCMSAGQHIGKLVVRMDRDEPLLRPRSSALPDWSNGVVLITGGTGGLGLEVARWMIEQGARHLVLIGRRAETAALSAQLAPLRASAVVEVIPADVSSEKD